jgi:putative DNA primase/helicase
VREALVWLGRADPCDTMMAIRAEDPIATALAGLIDCWCETIGTDKPITTQALVEMAGRVDLSGNYAYAELREALLAIAADGREISSRRLGKWLAKRDSRIVHGHKIVKDGVLLHKTVQWVVVKA